MPPVPLGLVGRSARNRVGREVRGLRRRESKAEELLLVLRRIGGERYPRRSILCACGVMVGRNFTEKNCVRPLDRRTLYDILVVFKFSAVL